MADRDWKARIVELVLVKQALQEVDSQGLWTYRLPHLAATESELASVEGHLGEPLDPQYRAFLRHASGWSAFFQTVDLFGHRDLLGSPRFAQASEMLDSVERNVLEAAGTDKSALLPIASAAVDRDLFVITRQRTSAPGRVFWIAGEIIDTFPSFDDFFDAMVDYNRLEIRALSPSG